MILLPSRSISVPCFVLATTIAATSSAHARTIEFSGRTWTVRSGVGGPGPNHWSDDAQSVWVDAQGRLHLRIRNVSGIWHCAEVVLQESLGHGEYRFQLATDATVLDPRTVIGLFTYLDDLNEIDIEMARWGDPQADVGQFVVQPYDLPGHLRRFPVTPSVTESTHAFRWLPGSVRFQSARGHHDGPPPSADLIHQWSFVGADTPSPDVERVHLNHWLFQGTPPSNGQESEVIVESFEFLPLGHFVPTLGDFGLAILAGAIIAAGGIIARRR